MSKKRGNNGNNNGGNKGGKNPAHKRERKKTRKFRERVLKRDNQTCYYCGGLGLTVDHLLPISLGGLSNMQNLVCCCHACNEEKADMTESEYRTYCNKRKTNQKMQNHRKILEQTHSYVICIECGKNSSKAQLKQGVCHKCREEKKKK